MGREIVPKYMNVELGLKSVNRRRKPNAGAPGKAHKRFENLLKGKFDIVQRNRIWCTEFTYLRCQTEASAAIV